MCSTDHDEELKKRLDQAVQDLLDAVELCMERRLHLPALTLMHAGIDAMAWLMRPAGQADVHEKDFLCWVERFVLLGSQLQCTGQDLYGARCALLHSQIAESRKSREGKAREVFYLIDASGAALFHVEKLNTPQLPVTVPLTELMQCFVRGIGKFQAAAHGDPHLAQLVYERVEHYFERVRLC